MRYYIFEDMSLLMKTVSGFCKKGDHMVDVLIESIDAIIGTIIDSVS